MNLYLNQFPATKKKNCYSLNSAHRRLRNILTILCDVAWELGIHRLSQYCYIQYLSNIAQCELGMLCVIFSLKHTEMLVRFMSFSIKNVRSYSKRGWLNSWIINKERWVYFLLKIIFSMQYFINSSFSPTPLISSSLFHSPKMHTLSHYNTNKYLKYYFYYY